MILLLSKALVKRWKFSPLSLAEAVAKDPCYHPSMVWRVDWFRVGQTTSNILCTNDATAFSFVLIGQGKMGKMQTISRVVVRISEILGKFGVDEASIREATAEAIIGYDPNMSAIGVMTDQKFRYEWKILEPPPGVRTLDDVERRANECPCGARDMGFPVEMFQSLVSAEWPTKPSSVPLTRGTPPARQESRHGSRSAHG